MMMALLLGLGELVPLVGERLLPERDVVVARRGGEDVAGDGPRDAPHGGVEAVHLREREWVSLVSGRVSRRGRVGDILFDSTRFDSIRLRLVCF